MEQWNWRFINRKHTCIKRMYFENLHAFYWVHVAQRGEKQKVRLLTLCDGLHATAEVRMTSSRQRPNAVWATELCNQVSALRLVARFKRNHPTGFLRRNVLMTIENEINPVNLYRQAPQPKYLTIRIYAKVISTHYWLYCLVVTVSRCSAWVSLSKN